MVEDPEESDKPDKLGKSILEMMVAMGGAYETKGQLMDELRAIKVGFKDAEMEPALIRLERAGLIIRAPFVKGQSRPGWLPSEGVIPSDS